MIGSRVIAIGILVLDLCTIVTHFGGWGDCRWYWGYKVVLEGFNASYFTYTPKRSLKSCYWLRRRLKVLGIEPGLLHWNNAIHCNELSPFIIILSFVRIVWGIEPLLILLSGFSWLYVYGSIRTVFGCLYVVLEKERELVWDFMPQPALKRVYSWLCITSSRMEPGRARELYGVSGVQGTHRYTIPPGPH